MLLKRIERRHYRYKRFVWGYAVISCIIVFVLLGIIGFISALRVNSASIVNDDPEGISLKLMIIDYLRAPELPRVPEPPKQPLPVPPSKTPIEIPANSTPTYTLSTSSGSYTATAGDTHTANFSASAANLRVCWYVASPGWYVVSPGETWRGTLVDTDIGDGSNSTTSSLSYTFPTGIMGDYVITVYAYSGDVSTTYETSYTVSVSDSTSTPLTVPVWGDIPDPFKLSVGDSFRLDLNSYVSGSSTIAINLGDIPSGLSLRGGVLGGKVRGVETRSLQFTATNAAGTAHSELVTIVVSAYRERRLPGRQ